MKFIQKFVELMRDEDGAISVEYVVLAVAVIAAGTAAAGLITSKMATYTTL